jgi:hypothetical protein
MWHILIGIWILLLTCLWAAGAFESFRATITGTEDRTSKPMEDPKAVSTRLWGMAYWSNVALGALC